MEAERSSLFIVSIYPSFLCATHHECQRSSGHHRSPRSRGHELLYATASRYSFLPLPCEASRPLHVLTSAPPIAGYISSISKRQLARAQSEGFEPAKPKPVRRHSSGDHAFLPDQKQKDAINAAKKNFGVPPELMQDREVCVMANDACDAISLS